jgi:hypothetical protein
MSSMSRAGSSQRPIVPIVAGVLRVFRLASLVVAVAVSAALAFTASGPAATPTRASWSAAANGICATGNARIHKLPKGTSPAVRAATLRAIAGIVSGENAKLSALPRPASELPNITFFLAKARALVALYRQAARAEDAGDKASYSRTLTTIKEVGYYYDFSARVLEARVCTEPS